MALKQRGLANTIIGVGHRKSSLDQALAVGAVDHTSLDVRQVAKDADLVVIATPAALVTSVLDGLRGVCNENAVVTDMASTKQEICEHAQNTWAHPSTFIGSHPMAGSEKSGPEHANPDLFAGAVTLVEVGDHLDAKARQTVIDLWTALGAIAIDVVPSLHDALVARTSHIPHILSACMALLASRKGDLRLFVGPGFRDVTRVAEGRPEIWRDICLTNSNAIGESLDELIIDLQGLRQAVASQDAEALNVFFTKGRQARLRVVGP